jgi:hypothetical protein
VTAADVDVDAIARSAEGCPGVASLSPGPVGLAVSYLPNQRVEGVRATAELVEVHVIARWGMTVQDVDREVRAALSGMTAGRRLDVVIEDVDVPAAVLR